VITAVRPSTPDRWPAKGAIGQRLEISANVFADGHDRVAARARWAREASDQPWLDVRLDPLGNDRFATSITPEDTGAHHVVIEGWIDRHGTWRDRINAKLAAGQDVTQELEEGARLIEADRTRLPTSVRAKARAAVAALRDAALSDRDRVAAATEPGLADALSLLPTPDATTTSGPWPVWVERERAAVGAWYEIFPRSYGGLPGTTQRLAYVAALGFDVVYLPPIHPIGRTARKGAGNSLTPGPTDPGSPWAIGSPEGGHDAIASELGTIDDFDELVAEAGRRGIEVALDYALQCSPDHPWVDKHPEWFSHRPDGSIRFAENPPKQYQDIFPIDFLPDNDDDRVALWEACFDVLEHWIEHGVRIFRVDNPHTKPFAFWAWLIARMRGRHPDAVMLAEAFTTPAVMHRLAEIGFSQSYTYFTWRTSKDELIAYGEELAHGPDASYFRPNLWPNTPDILSGPLRDGPPAAFKLRAVLAATLGPSWGVYSGYELCENTPASDTNEEYANSEKYEIPHRDWESPATIAPYLAQLNTIRRRHVALGDLSSLRFHATTHPAQIAYSKRVGLDTVLAVVSLDPWSVTEGMVHLDLAALGLPGDERFDAHDELGEQTFAWRGSDQYVRLDPERPAHVLSLRSATAPATDGATDRATGVE